MDQHTLAGEDAALFAELARIEGFDTAAGLSHTGDNAEAYLDILRQFCDEYDIYEAEINQYFEAENWKNYAIKLHAMKGVFATIGMEPLAQWARRLELAAKSGDTGTCRDETGGICEAMRSFREALEETSLMLAAEAGPKTVVESELLKQKLGELRSACMKGDCDTADALTAELSGMSLDPETDRAVTEICTLAARLDYDAAVKRINRLPLCPPEADPAEPPPPYSL